MTAAPASAAPLAPCPFPTCGNLKVYMEQSLSLWFVYCPSCNAHGPNEQTEAAAIAAWNNRTAPDDPSD